MKRRKQLFSFILSHPSPHQTRRTTNISILLTCSWKSFRNERNVKSWKVVDKKWWLYDRLRGRDSDCSAEKCENKWSLKFCVKLEKCDLRAVWWLFRRGKTIFEISECHLIESHYFGSGILPSRFYYCQTFRAGVRLRSLLRFVP